MAVPKIIEIAGGTYQQGLDSGRDEPGHEVTIKSFALGKYEVTFEEYDRFAIAAGRDLPDDHTWGRVRRPVINVSWNDAKAYAHWLSKATGKSYRLLTLNETALKLSTGTYFKGTNSDDLFPKKNTINQYLLKALVLCP